jgi:hypothetical protein
MGERETDQTGSRGRGQPDGRHFSRLVKRTLSVVLLKKDKERVDEAWRPVSDGCTSSSPTLRWTMATDVIEI